MAQPAGRIIRAALGFLVIGGTAGSVVGIIGFVPLAAGVFNFCLLSPLAGGYLDRRRKLEGAPPRGRSGAPQH